MTVARFARITGWTLAALVGVLALCLVLLANFNWNHARPWINERVSEALGRPFAIRGDLTLQWLDSETPEEGWRRWVPWPHLQAQDIALDNATWAKSGPHMAAIQRLSVSLNPLPLLTHTIRIPSLEVDGLALALERQANGEANWALKLADSGSSEPSPWKLDLQRLVLRQGSIKLDDASQQLKLQADIDSLPQPSAQGYGIRWKLAGNYRKTAVQGSGQAGSVLSLQQSTDPFPLQAAVRVGRTRIEVAGTLTRPEALAALDLRLKLAGDSMADLYPITGITLPKTPPFSTEGRLTGSPGKGGGRWLYQGFKGRVGESDIGGTLEYIGQQPRSLLRGQVQSNQLRLVDLAPLIGADSNTAKTKRGAAPTQPSDKVLPIEKFDTASWSSIDADVKFTGRKIVRATDLPIDSLVANLSLKDSVISLTPLSFGVAGGTLASTIRLDGRQPIIRANVQVAARRLKLNQLIPTLDSVQEASLGEFGGDVALSATGDSVASMLASSNGELKTRVRDGTMSKFILEAVGLNVGSVIATKLFGDRKVKLNCLASDFQINQGVMRPRAFVLDTDESTINIGGTIDLAREQLALEIKPRNKSLRVFSLQAPLYVAGNFKKPDVGIDKGTVALKLGAAAVLGAVAAPVAALLPLMNVGTEEKSECLALQAAAEKKPKAPPPRIRKARR